METIKRKISANGGLSCYKWYQNQTPSDVTVRTLGLESEWIGGPTSIGKGSEIPYQLGGIQSILYKGMETSTRRRVLKILRGSVKGKTQKEPKKKIYISSGLGRYTTNFYFPSFPNHIFLGDVLLRYHQ